MSALPEHPTERDRERFRDLTKAMQFGLEYDRRLAYNGDYTDPQTVAIFQIWWSVERERQLLQNLNMSQGCKLSELAQKLEKAEDVLRSLASFVGAGGYNADKVDADVFEQKIRWGIGQIMERLEKAEAELAKLREREAKQKPVAMVDAGDDGYFAEILPDCSVSVGDMLYAFPPLNIDPELWKPSFDQWWNAHGQYLRAGGGQYEKTFGYHAWEAAAALYASPVPAVAAPADQFRDATKLVEFRDSLFELVSEVRSSGGLCSPGVCGYAEGGHKCCRKDLMDALAAADALLQSTPAAPGELKEPAVAAPAVPTDAAARDGLSVQAYHEWIRGALRLPDTAPMRLDFYAQEIEKLLHAPAVPYGVDEEAANRIALAVYDCKHGINQEPLLYAINRILVTEAHPLSAEGQRALLQSANHFVGVTEKDAARGAK